MIEAERKVKLGFEYDLWYFSDGTLRPDLVIRDYDPADTIPFKRT
jgi:hypothetical protein